MNIRGVDGVADVGTSQELWLASRNRKHSKDNSGESRYDAVIRTLAENQPDCVMEAFLDPENYNILFRSLPAPTFAEAFRLLSPKYFIERYIKLHRHFHQVVAEGKKYKHLRKICDEFFGNITTIANMRRQAGHKLGLDEYTHLLDCARSMGNGDMANEVWKHLFQDGVRPNLECYNYYMEARVWDMAYYSKEKWNLRVTPLVQKKRSQPFRNPNFQGYKTGDGGVKDEISGLFSQMTEQGIQGDEHTFVNVMVASCREGHMSGLKDILKAVWEIDVDLLSLTKDENAIPQVKPYAPTSPLHPTDRLLHAVAHMFGTNHDFPGGLQTVDFISRKYNVPIPRYVWLELFEWAFVLSVERKGPNAYENNPGKIPSDAVTSVFETMTSPPYNIRPTMPMYNMLVKVSWSRQSQPQTLKYMRAGFTLFKRTLRTRSHFAGKLLRLRRLFRREQSRHTQQIFNRVLHDFYSRAHKYSICQLKAARDASLLERWARLLISGRRHWTNRETSDWQRRRLPEMIEEWKLFLPRHVYYQTDQGTVAFCPYQFWGVKGRLGAESESAFESRKSKDVARIAESFVRGLPAGRRVFDSHPVNQDRHQDHAREPGDLESSPERKD